MKTVLLMDNKSLDFYDFDVIKKELDVEIYLMCCEPYFSSLPHSLKQHFRDIFVSDTVEGILKNQIPEHFAQKVIEENFSKQISMGTFYISCAHALNISLARKLREKYRLFGSYPKDMACYENKITQKKAMSDNGVATPKFLPFTYDQIMDGSEPLLDEIVDKCGLPFIAKPADLAGSIGVQLIYSADDFYEYTKSLPSDLSKEYIFEQYIDGQLFHVDLVTNNKETVFSQSCEYLFNGLSFVNGHIHGSLPLNVDDERHIRLVEFCKHINKVLGLVNGCTHHEVFIDHNDNLVFLEAACRPPGSSVPKIYKSCFNVNIMNYNLFLDCDIPFSVAREDLTKAFWSIIPSKNHEHIIEKIPDFIENYKIDFLEKVDNQVASLADQSAVLEIQNDSYEKLINDFKSIRSISKIINQKVG